MNEIQCAAYKAKLDELLTLIEDHINTFNIDEFNLLVDNCINLELTNTRNWRIIHLVCRYGTLDMLHYLISKNVELKCISEYNMQPIHYACMRGDKSLELVKCLVEHGVDINCASEFNYPIHISCENGDNGLELVKYLMDHGANINCTDCNEMYPIDYAFMKVSLQLTNYFLKINKLTILPFNL